MTLCLKEKLKNWIKSRSKRTKNRLFLFLLFVAYVMSVGIRIAEWNILQYLIYAAVVLVAVYLAIMIMKNIDERKSNNRPDQRKSML